MSDFALVAHQVKLEQKSFWRNPDAAFFTLLLPLGLLGILGALNRDPIPGHAGARFVDLMVPGIVVFGLLAAAYGNLVISIAVLRDDGVLKRVRVTPLPRWTYLAGHVVSALVLTTILASLTIAMGWVVFGVHVQAHAAVGVVVTLALGAACLCALGLAVSGFVPNAQAASPIVNASYLPLAIVSGVFFPMRHIPSWLASLVSVFPVKRLTDALQGAFDPSRRAPVVKVGDLAVVGVWLVVALVVAHRRFRWDRSG